MSATYVGIDFAAHQLGRSHGEQLRVQNVRTQIAYFTAGLHAAQFQQDGQDAYFEGFIAKYEGRA